ncbi:MAG TPA: Flp family type IVb pilin [Propionicimonas sp.]|jgi:Flp pilus assembly pilin Flp|nr:Flp family type IVb pilin [Propionicimonas sp.]
MQKMTANVVATPTESTPRRNRGAAAIEYGIMIALISAVLLATIALTGNSLSALFYQITFLFMG